MSYEYAHIFFFTLISIALSLIILGVSYLFASQKPDIEKISPYECGFNPFFSGSSKFDIRFYLVAILFIIFDLEISFLFPWTVSLSRIGVFGFWTMAIFLFILTVGFIYEWRKGALEWS